MHGAARGPNTILVFCTNLNSWCETYERQSAVAASSNLGLVGVDIDSRVAEGAATTVTADDSLLCPADGLLVDELNGGIGLGLVLIIVSRSVFHSW